MNIYTTEICTALAEKSKSILELGSGLNSTCMFREKASQNGGYVLSLENKQSWADKVREITPDNDFGRIEVCGLNRDRSRYAYSLKEKYDLILIDGPAWSSKIGAKWRNHRNNKFKNLPVVVDNRNGTSSIFMLEYVLPAMHDETIVVIDGRVKAAIYCYLHHGKDMNMFWFGPTYGIKELRRCVSTGHPVDAQYRQVTVITHLQSIKWKEYLKGFKLFDARGNEVNG